ncbi:endonuclease/exonuclease/phosphatase family protein [Consotaella aegiceratis]|uniref:endonuclease/exonuclease/phosphatase family protein n=1 Tax=Consotaella aegiceratis TaxID=3097961 RepID=UPI002F3EB588
MRLWLPLFASLVLLSLPTIVHGAGFSVGQQVVLRASNALGVPLHRKAQNSLFGRGEDGSLGKITEVAHGGKWLHVQIEHGAIAWIVSKYLESASDEAMPITPSDASEQLVGPFSSRASCERAVQSGARFEPKDHSQIRIATWNIRWFPIGDPHDSGKETDLAWLACAIAYLEPDVVALQEITAGPEANVAWAVVTDGVQKLVGGDWRVDLQECGGESSQHVGFLYNSRRVTLSGTRDIWEMNGAAKDPLNPCAGNLRPGRAAYVRKVGTGADFHLVAVHADSGTSERDYNHRQEAIGRLGALFDDLQQDVSDSDMVVLGDFNTMGAQDIMSGPAEIDRLRQHVRTEAPGFRLIDNPLHCSEYFDGACSWLDQVIVTESMEEVRETKIAVSGYCAMLEGRPFGSAEPAAYKALSDHCPIVVDVLDQDLD